MREDSENCRDDYENCKEDSENCKGNSENWSDTLYMALICGYRLRAL